MTLTVVDALVMTLLSLALITPYVIYPLLVRHLVRPVKRGPSQDPGEPPVVSVLIPAHNEAVGDRLVAEHPGEALLADAVPGVQAEAVDAALVALTLVAVRAFPARTAPALSRRSHLINQLINQSAA